MKLSEARKGRLQNPGSCKENRYTTSSTLAFFPCCNLHLRIDSKKGVRPRAQSWCSFHLIIETQRTRTLRISFVSVSQSRSKVLTVSLPSQYTHVSSQSYWINFPFHSLAFKALFLQHVSNYFQPWFYCPHLQNLQWGFQPVTIVFSLWLKCKN